MIMVGCSRCTYPISWWKAISRSRSVARRARKGTFHYRNISGEEFIFYYGFKLNLKNGRRGKLQSLRLDINSKTIGL